MKNYLIISICVLASIFGVNAQSPIRWGVEAGLNLSKPTEATQTDFGFNVGVTGELLLSHGWFLDAALKLTSQPWTLKNEYSIYEQPVVQKNHFSRTPYSLILPIHAGYAFGVGSKTEIFVAVGPYIGYGLFGGGKTRVCEVTDGVVTNERVWNINNPFYDMKRFQVGGDARVGVEFCGHYTAGVGYQLQFNDMAKGSFSQRAQVFSINLGYKF